MNDLEEARMRVAELRKKQIAARSGGGELLSAPGCDKGCVRCPRACAVTGIILNWWEAELARLAPTDNVVAFPGRALTVRQCNETVH